jgi:hypothetical protein
VLRSERRSDDIVVTEKERVMGKNQIKSSQDSTVSSLVVFGESHGLQLTSSQVNSWAISFFKK